MADRTLYRALLIGAIASLLPLQAIVLASATEGNPPIYPQVVFAVTEAGPGSLRISVSYDRQFGCLNAACQVPEGLVQYNRYDDDTHCYFGNVRIGNLARHPFADMVAEEYGQRPCPGYVERVGPTEFLLTNLTIDESKPYAVTLLWQADYIANFPHTPWIGSDLGQAFISPGYAWLNPEVDLRYDGLTILSRTDGATMGDDALACAPTVDPLPAFPDLCFVSLP